MNESTRELIRVIAIVALVVSLAAVTIAVQMRWI